jgi:hypothetical protein
LASKRIHLQMTSTRPPLLAMAAAVPLVALPFGKNERRQFGAEGPRLPTVSDGKTVGSTVHNFAVFLPAGTSDQTAIKLAGLLARHKSSETFDAVPRVASAGVAGSAGVAASAGVVASSGVAASAGALALGFGSVIVERERRASVWSFCRAASSSLLDPLSPNR